MTIRILLLQARAPDDPVCGEERRSFAHRAGIPIDAIQPYDLLGGAPTVSTIRRHDALMVGGSGDYYVSRADLPEFERLMDVLREIVARGHPTFASCFGFQLLVRALGGVVVHDASAMEVGTYPLSLTPAGRADSLFGLLPDRFDAQVGRKDRATALPHGVLHLASSERCPYHALRVPDQPIWATQFHPELSGAENRTRFLRYREGYAPFLSEEEGDRVLELFRESPDSGRLIPAFLDLVFGER